jgi:ATP-binding cassette subfamily C protein
MSRAPDQRVVLPVPLAVPGDVPLVVTAGAVTLFLVDDARGGTRTPVATLGAPALVSVVPAPTGQRWVLGGALGSRVEEADVAADGDRLPDAVATSAAALSDRLRELLGAPRERVAHLSTRTQQLEAGSRAVVEELAWVTATGGAATLGGHPLPAAGAPLGPRLAVTVSDRQPAGVRAGAVAEPGTQELLEGLTWLFSVTAEEVVRAGAARAEEEVALAATAAARSAAAEQRGVSLLARQLGTSQGRAPADHDDPLLAAAAEVLAVSGLTLVVPRGGFGEVEGTDAVRALALSSGCFARRVTLTGPWWLRPAEPALGFRPDGTPVALLPDGSGGVLAADRAGEARIDEATAAGVLDTAFTFSRPLVDGTVDARRLGRVATRGRGRDLATYAGWAALLSVAGLAVPFASGVVFDDIVPHGDRARLWWLLASLAVVALAMLPVQVALASVRTRIETGAAFDVGRGLWGRVLRSRVGLVRRLGAGDVANRLAGLEGSRDQHEKTVLGALPTVLSGLLAGLVLFHYNAALAALVFGWGLLLCLVSVLLARASAREQTKVDVATGGVNGFLFQVLAAIPKIRVAGAEPRAFLAWAVRFAPAVGLRAIQVASRQLLLSAMLPTLGTLGLVAAVTVVGPSGLEVGVFIAFQTTYSLFVGGVAATAAATSAALQTRPAVSRVVELAQARLDSEGPAEQERLLGGVRLVDVTFRYGSETRPALDGLSLGVQPGELVAIAGPSGSGKSTILRLLLGFEEPQQGSVIYDDTPLTSLDLSAVRRQLGVVLQDGQLLPGTVHDNLSGVATLSEQEAWELAEIVALADDIREMPMKLATVVTLNGGAFSGGQRQRLLIARALASRPRILLLDEATSALDNITQKVITDNLAQLGMTRIVVAHRLSTMVGADRILVVEDGRLDEQGRYEELMERRGRFHTLASRQVL